MDIVFIDVPDAWGFLLSRKWATTLARSLQMNLSYATILVEAQGHIMLSNNPKGKKHINYLIMEMTKVIMTL
jgi:hypothetical protein